MGGGGRKEKKERLRKEEEKNEAGIRYFSSPENSRTSWQSADTNDDNDSENDNGNNNIERETTTTTVWDDGPRTYSANPPQAMHACAVI